MAKQTPAERVKALSPRELQVAKLLSTGSTNKQASVKLDLSYETVRSYAATMNKKLGVHNRAQLVLMMHAYKQGKA